jgi:hypothetical protein
MKNMNHPEFSNMENSGFFIPKRAVYWLFFASLKNRPLKNLLGRACF